MDPGPVGPQSAFPDYLQAFEGSAGTNSLAGTDRELHLETLTFGLVLFDDVVLYSVYAALRPLFTMG